MTDEVKQDMTLSEYWVPPNVIEISLVDYPAEVTSYAYNISVGDLVKEFTQKSVGTDLWIDLIWEEVQELFEAYDEYNWDGAIDATTDLTNSTSLLKEMADLVYVVHGLANELGWDLDEAIQRVHKSNMSKLDDNGQPIYREDGKRMKSKNYKPPYLEDLV